MLRKITLLIVCLCYITAQAADSRIVLPAEVDDITFYGVDFSLVNIIGDDATDQQYLQAFRRINELFVTEPEKYNIAKCIKSNISEYDFEVVNALNGAIDMAQARPLHSNMLSDEELAAHIAQIPVDGDAVGLIIVADNLNKTQEKGYFHFIFFDQATRTIVAKAFLKGKARGFGLRNHWARAILNSMKSLRVTRR